MNNSKVMTGLLALGLSAGLSAMLTTGAEARTVAAEAGRAISFSDQGCFSIGYGSAQNNCSTARAWETALPIDSSGNKTVRVAAYGASAANNVGCTAVGVNREITSVWSSGTAYLPAFGSSQVITLTGAYVPGSGLLYAACTVNPGGRVNGYDWNQ